MRDERGRSKRVVRTGFVSVAVSGLAWTVAAGCSQAKSTEPPPYEAVCTRTVTLPCANDTFDECVAQAHKVEDVARKAGCGTEFDQVFACIDAHPDGCENGVLVQDGACDSLGQAQDDCLLKSDPAGLCKLTAGDPCNDCICRECTCDAECRGATRGWADCQAACSFGDAGDFTGCFNGCTAKTPAAFQKYLSCATSSVCESACSGSAPDGGKSGP